MLDLILLVIQIFIMAVGGVVALILVPLEWIIFNFYSLVINVILNLFLIIVENINYKPTLWVKFKGV